MKKLYILRGHSGSGKSHLAKQIKEDNPNANVIEINNDDYIIKKHGYYAWTPDNINEAVNENDKKMRELLKTGSDKNQDLILISSNMNIASNKVLNRINQALANNFEVEVLNLKNFYPNEHKVDKTTVLSLYLASELNAEKISDFIENLEGKNKDKISMKDYKVKNTFSPEFEKEMEKKLDKVKNYNVTYDNERNTYVTKEFIEHGNLLKLFIKKQSETYPDLYVYKYSNKVFFENLFSEPLLEMRGLVMDENDNIIIRPFKKVFNYSEMVAENAKFKTDLKDEDKVKLVRKVNGYLGVCTYIEGCEGKSYNNKTVYSTTGSLDSEYAILTEKHCQQYEAMFKNFPNHTFLFEVCDENDPHIVKEEFGVYLIGMIDVKTGEMKKESFLDELAQKYNVKRPETIEMTFGETKELLKKVEHEGFMVIKDDKVACKMKSPYYLITKLFGRMKQEKLEKILNKKNIDEEYYEVVDYIKENLKSFKTMEEQEKIDFIRNFLTEKYYELEKTDEKSHLKTRKIKV